MSCHGTGTVVILDDSQCAGCPGGSDWTDCINNTVASLGAGGTLQFKRGEVYNVSGPLVIDYEDVTWEATGSGARPIINFSVSPNGGGVGIRKAGATLLDLDIRGPHYNVGAWADFNRYGINASRDLNVPTPDGLYISGLSMDLSAMVSRSMARTMVSPS
ncbi:MAG TPA: hypothetical protein VMO26_16215 [Vicinamibacterales bacterium]|nr:hypothetical protein [Vicinamibacterales bacterium]